MFRFLRYARFAMALHYELRSNIILVITKFAELPAWCFAQMMHDVNWYAASGARWYKAEMGEFEARDIATNLIALLYY